MYRSMLPLRGPHAGDAFDGFLRTNVELKSDDGYRRRDGDEQHKRQQQFHSLDLDRNNLLDDQVADDLKPDRSSQHGVPDLILEKELHVIGIDEEHDYAHADRDTRKSDARHLAVSADRLDTAAQLEAL